jgi:hypothetical protein
MHIVAQLQVAVLQGPVPRSVKAVAQCSAQRKGDGEVMGESATLVCCHFSIATRRCCRHTRPPRSVTRATFGACCPCPGL